HHNLAYFVELLNKIKHGKTSVTLDSRITLPSGRDFPGQIEVKNAPGDFEIRAKYHGDPTWMSTKEITTSAPARIFIYSESDLPESEILELKREGLTLGHEVQFRSVKYVIERGKHEKPLAFISHDSRDKDIARAIAIKLNKTLCPVWYDEFTLKVGDNPR